MTFGQYCDSMIEFGDTKLKVDRPRTKKAIKCALLEWLTPPVNVNLRKWRKEYAQRTYDRYRDTYGFPLAAWLFFIVAGQVIGFIVRKLLEEWFNDKAGKDKLFCGFRAELEHNT